MKKKYILFIIFKQLTLFDKLICTCYLPTYLLNPYPPLFFGLTTIVW
jgi:hypothetical protein